MYFVMGVPDSAKPNHPFVVNRCNEVGEDNGNFTLDIWAREHYKSTIKTIGKNIQRILGDSERAVGIFSHKASVAKKFLFEIKQHLEGSEVLKACFPDVLWENPRRDAPIWSLDEGLVLRRKTNRKESTVGAFGLVEGMPVGLHFDHMDFDDIVTADIGDSADVMEKVKERFDVAMNLGTDGGSHTVTGTIYHYNDPVVYIRDKVDPLTGKMAYRLRQYTSTDDGSPSGKPVFNSEEREAQLRLTKTYRTQQLCDPTPSEMAKLKSAYIESCDELPRKIYKFMVVDQAGDLDANKSAGDCWAISLFGVEPKIGDVGASDVYLLDCIAEPLSESEAVDLIARMYVDAGTVRQLGVEKVGISSTHNRIKEVLKSRGRYLVIENDSKKRKNNAIILLRPSGRNKNKFIESTVEWPLNNGKIHITDEVPIKYREKLELEMDQFPYGKTDDILNTFAYLYDMLTAYNFPVMERKSSYVSSGHRSDGPWIGGS